MRHAYSLIELVVICAILALLVAILLPAVQSSRESIRRLSCSNQLRQIGIAIANYEATHRAFPPGANSYGFSMHVTILPYMENHTLAELFQRVDQSADPETGNRAVRFLPARPFLCPSDPESFIRGRNGGTNYAACFGTGVQAYGYNGAFRHIDIVSSRYPGGITRANEVTDGLTNSAFVSEILTASGTPKPLRTNWYTLESLIKPDELARFSEACLTRNYKRDKDGQPEGNTSNRGRPWVYGDAGITFYNHVLKPNSPSCVNGSKVQLGAYSAASTHIRGTNVLFGDGHVSFVSENVDYAIWKDFGSIYSGMN